MKHHTVVILSNKNMDNWKNVFFTEQSNVILIQILIHDLFMSLS